MPRFVEVPATPKKVDDQILIRKPFNIVDPFDGKKPFKTNVVRERNWGAKIQQAKRNSIKMPSPGEGLPRVMHYCADQGGCAFWRLIFVGDELLATNKAVVQTMYQMIPDPNIYATLAAVRLQRQCNEPQKQFIKHLRHVSDMFKHQGKPGFKIIYEVDDLIDFSSIPSFNLCSTAFADPAIVDNVKEIIHNCVIGDTIVCVSLDGVIVDITIEEVLEHFNESRNIKILSKDITNDTICFKSITDCKMTDDNAEVIELYDDISGSSLICTKDHPIYTKNRSWIRAADILPGDILDIL